MDEFMTKKECAAFLRVSEQTIDVWRKYENFPYFKMAKMARLVLFSKKRVSEWMKKFEQNAAEAGKENK